MTIEIPEELAIRLSALPQAADDPHAFILSAIAEAVDSAEAEEEVDPVAVAEIEAALDELEADNARGDYGVTLEEVRDHLEGLLTERRHAQMAESTITRAAA